MINKLEHSPFRGNPYFEQYVNLLIKLHTAMRSGDEAEAEDLREQMDAPAIHLNSEEIQWVKGLSADLYMLADDEDFRTLDRSEYQLLMDLRTALNRSDGETALHLLRQAYFIRPEHRAWFRSSAYAMLGYFAISQMFLSFAADQAPGNFQYKYMLLAKFMGQKDYTSARTLAMMYAEEQDQHPMLNILIAIVLYQSTEFMSRSEAMPFLRLAVKINTASSSEGLTAADVLMRWMILGYCHYRLGNVDEAIAADNEAVNVDPANANVLEARGRHRLNVDYHGALDDFQEAIRIGMGSPYPYLFIIRERLVRRQYGDAITLCNDLIRRHTDERVQAQAHEFLATALYGLGRPFSEVQEAYATALSLVPSGRRQRNFQDLTVANMGVIPRAEILFPLLSVEEVEAIEDNDEPAERQPFPLAGDNSDHAGRSFISGDVLSTYSLVSQKQVTENLFTGEKDLLLAA